MHLLQKPQKLHFTEPAILPKRLTFSVFYVLNPKAKLPSRGNFVTLLTSINKYIIYLLYLFLYGVSYKCTEANKEVVQKESCKDLKQTRNGLLFTNKTFRNSSEYRAQMTPEVRKMIAEERKKAREAENKIRREKQEKRQREIELENKERYKKWMEKQAYEKEVEAKRKAAHEKAEKLFKKYYERLWQPGMNKNKRI